MSLKSSRIPGLNDALTIGNCMADEKKISPSWLRVSITPWEISAKKIRGYGRPVNSSSISDQMPPEFKRTEHLQRPPDLPKEKREIASRRPGLDAAHVLPGGMNLISQQTPKHGHQIKKYRFQNQVIMEPVLTGRPNDRVRTKFDPPMSTRREGETSRSTAKLITSPIKTSQHEGCKNITINSSRAKPNSLAYARPDRSSTRFAAMALSSLA